MRCRTVRWLPALAVLLAFQLPAAARKVWTEDFSSGSLSNWLLTVPSDWLAAGENGNRILRLQKEGPVGANPRRPLKFAFYRPGCVSDFELTVRVRREDRADAESDVTIAFGFQNRVKFYYTHLSRDTGDHAVHNGIFRVNEADRERIAGKGSAPALPDTGWHRIRVVRETASGRIAVYVDQDPNPRFQVVDRTHAFGLVGLGSFDNKAEFADFRLEGTPARGCPAGIEPVEHRP